MPSRSAAYRLRSATPAGVKAWWAVGALFSLSGMCLMAVGCAGDQRRDVVPRETEQRSQEFYGRQQRSMDSFNQTPSEQAGERHEQDTRPVRPVEEER